MQDAMQCNAPIFFLPSIRTYSITMPALESEHSSRDGLQLPFPSALQGAVYLNNYILCKWGSERVPSRPTLTHPNPTT